jgi:hypothetical protein
MYIALTVDTQSDSYKFGQVIGYVIMALIAIGIAWKATGDWRNPIAKGMADLEQVQKISSKRTRIQIACNVALLAVAVTAGTLQAGSTNQAAPTTLRTISPPATVGSYTLMPEAAAAQLTARLKIPTTVHVSYYVTSANPTQPTIMLETDAQEWDPGLAQQQAESSLAAQLNSIFAGAGASSSADGISLGNPQNVSAGPLGGEMQCATVSDSRDMCAWVDGSTFGAVYVLEQVTVQQAATIALEFRNSAEH